TLEFNDVYQEVKGSMNDGRLRLSRQGIIFKNSKMGKVDNIQAGELTEGIWRRVALGHGLKLLTKNGHVYKYHGFQESEFEKLSDFFKTHYRLELMEKDLCVKGWNWGTVKFGGQLLSFDIGDQPIFEIPLSNVSQCTTGKNEVTPESHQNDDASSGLLYPLERGFIYLHKPPVHIRFDEISFVNFARGTTTTRSFDFEIETKQGTQYTFSSIEREEYGELFDFVNAKKLNIKNRGLKEGMNASYDEYADSDEDQHDAYLERMKEEGKIREEHANDSSDDSGEETDESFNPGEEEEDVAEEFDSNASASSSSNDGDSNRQEKKRKQLKKAKMAKDRKSRKKALEVKKGKDPNAPKRPVSVYMLWLNASREKIKSDHPGISVTDLSKKAGEIWKGMSKEKKEEWGRKAEDARREYEKAMKEYKGGRGESSKRDKSKKKKKVKVKMEKKSTPSRGSSLKSSSRQLSESFKSKEFVSSDESSSGKNKSKKKRRRSEDSEEEELASTPPSSENSASGSDE
ncbi:hypothetical protein G4228_020478, partial [Cervus hanglu yarkandensis]